MVEEVEGERHPCLRLPSLLQKEQTQIHVVAFQRAEACQSEKAAASSLDALRTVDHRKLEEATMAAATSGTVLAGAGRRQVRNLVHRAQTPKVPDHGAGVSAGLRPGAAKEAECGVGVDGDPC